MVAGYLYHHFRKPPYTITGETGVDFLTVKIPPAFSGEHQGGLDLDVPKLCQATWDLDEVRQNHSTDDG